jgi:hypothetical protein
LANLAEFEPAARRFSTAGAVSEDKDADPIASMTDAGYGPVTD